MKYYILEHFDMRLEKIAIRLMSKYCVGFDKVAIFDAGGVLPDAVISMDESEAQEWARGIIPAYQSAVTALAGKPMNGEKVSGEKVKLDGWLDCRKFISDFLKDGGFKNVSDVGGAPMADSLRNIGRSLTRIFDDWAGRPEIARTFKAWNRENGVEYQSAIAAADAIARVKLYVDKIAGMASSKIGVVGIEIADMKAKEMLKAFLYGSMYVKNLNDVMKDIQGGGIFVDQLAKRLVDEKHHIGFMGKDISKDDLEGQGEFDEMGNLIGSGQEKIIKKLMVLCETIMDEAKMFNIMNISPSMFAGKIIKALQMMGYAIEGDIDAAKADINSAISSFLSDENVAKCVNEIMSSENVRGLNRDVSGEPSGYSPIEDFQERISLETDKALKEMEKNRKPMINDSVDVSLDDVPTIEQVVKMFEELKEKRKTVKLKGMEEFRYGRLEGLIAMYKQLIQARKDKNKELETKILNQLDGKLRLREDEGRHNVMESALNLKNKEKQVQEMMDKDPNMVLRNSFMKRNDSDLSSKDKKDVEVAIKNVKMKTTQLRMFNNGKNPSAEAIQKARENAAALDMIVGGDVSSDALVEEAKAEIAKFKSKNK